jgi:outer membrane protein OmpA-like peptidoglycan-associated protein
MSGNTVARCLAAAGLAGLAAGAVPHASAQPSFTSYDVRFNSYDATFNSYEVSFSSYAVSLSAADVAFASHDARLPVVGLTDPVANTDDDAPAPEVAATSPAAGDAPAASEPGVTEVRVRYRLSGDILFDFDKSDIRPRAEVILADLAARIARGSAGATVRVEGHTDAKGSDDYNQALSERRAASVKEWFARLGGIEESLISTQGFGETRPVTPNQRTDGTDDPVGRQQNRRVEIVVEG